MATLTVFSPAFNRAHTLPRTYQSLLRQTSKDFVWLVVDDGSSDNTEDLVNSWIAEDKIEIKYVRQENQGMHGAHNTAYDNIDTELNVCIDSDDWMPDDAVETIIDFWNKNKNDRYAGIIGLDCREDGSIIGTRFPENLKETTLTDFNARIGRGDKKLVYRTDVVKKYPKYPLFEGERYVGLAYLYMLIDRDYKVLTINKPLVIVEYQPDGSSNSMYRQYWRNPKGFSFFRRTTMVLQPTLKRRFAECIHYVATSIISRDSKFISKSPKKLMTLMATIPGLMWYFIIRHKVRTNASMHVS